MSRRPAAAPGRSALAIGGTGAIAALGFAGAPWWALFAVFVIGCAVSCVVSVVHAVFPHESRDKLDWWRDRRRARVAAVRARSRPRAAAGDRPEA